MEQLRAHEGKLSDAVVGIRVVSSAAQAERERTRVIRKKWKSRDVDGKLAVQANDQRAMVTSGRIVVETVGVDVNLRGTGGPPYLYRKEAKVEGSESGEFGRVRG